MQRLRPFWYRWFPRYRFYCQMEASVFARGGRTRILLLTDHEIPVYRAIYGTEPDRFHVLPPGIMRRDFAPAARGEARERVRRELGCRSGDAVLVLVGSGFRVKGLDRAILALASLPPAQRDRTHLAVIGRNHPGAFARLAARLGVRPRVHFLGARDDVPAWLLGSDLLVHPAHSESAGMVLLEALTCGLPVVTTDRCGYAFHIEKAGAGHVLGSPFDQEACNRAVAEMLVSPSRDGWRQRGLAYAQREDLYSCHDQAARLIAEAVEARCRPSQPE